MPPRARGSGQRKAATKGKARAPRSGKAKKQGDGAGHMTEEDRLATVCGYFCDEGLTAVEIQKRLKEDHSVPISREKPYEYLRKAASRGWIRFVPPQQHSLEADIKHAHPWLHEAIVIPSARTEDVAYRGAKMLLEMLQQHHHDAEVHIGFSGGTALRLLARRFAELLREPAQHLPSKIVFHALVAGFDVNDPTTDPNAFFTYFVGDPAIPVEMSFVALHSPAMVQAEFESEIRALPAIEEAYQRAKEIDIIVTSTSCWTDEHSMLRHYMAVAGESVDELEKAGCLGDILWQPIGADGPFELNSRIRAMTTMKLCELSKLISDKKHVLLVAGSCYRCHRPKTQVVKAILDQRHHLITHLVTDSRCARQMVLGMHHAQAERI
jgi:DNA-binding transcriptional regulator LsrR (DeoR family)